MALLKILTFPDPRLRDLAKPIEVIDDSILTLIDDMFETMYAAPGVGLAATQVGIDKRLAVIDVSLEKNQPLVLINPEIIARAEPVKFEEGCLSVPRHYDRLTRHNRVTLKAQDRHGNHYQLEAEGHLAECIQHEVDHLNGKLYLDYLSTLKQKLIRDKLAKKRK